MFLLVLLPDVDLVTYLRIYVFMRHTSCSIFYLTQWVLIHCFVLILVMRDIYCDLCIVMMNECTDSGGMYLIHFLLNLF